MSDPQTRTDRILTQAEQQAMTPQQVIDLLNDGNRRFVEGDVTHCDHRSQIRTAVKGQWPKAVVLSCLDSRVPVEDVFDCGIGDLFVARVAGNFVNVDILGSMEFACQLVGAKVVYVLGHEHCGAVKGAIDRVELGNLTAVLRAIAPAVDEVKDVTADRTVKNEKFVHRVAEQNVLRTVRRIRQESAILRELEAKGSIRIVGGMYDMDTGEVTPLSE
ncbi:MAG TPA: carbonic anhydrase family protein [Archangium sp.]